MRRNVDLHGNPHFITQVQGISPHTISPSPTSTQAKCWGTATDELREEGNCVCRRGEWEDQSGLCSSFQKPYPLGSGSNAFGQKGQQLPDVYYPGGDPGLVLVSLRISESQDSNRPSRLPSSDFSPDLESLLQLARIVCPSCAYLLIENASLPKPAQFTFGQLC